jgi:hypothetical protein
MFDVSLASPDELSVDGSFILRKQDIPAQSVRVVELPKHGAREVFHPAPRRQFIVYLKGALLLTASDGSSHLFEPGDWCLADDVGSVGHRVEIVGEETLMSVQFAMPDDWAWPDSFPSPATGRDDSGPL